MIKFINGIAFFIFMLLVNSCKDGGCNTYLNSVSFKTTLNPEQTAKVRDLQHGWTYADGGNCGLIVYNSGETILAYERCIVGNSNKLTVDGFVAVDSESGAKWLLKDGTPMHIAECPLQRCNVRKEGSFIVISN